MSGGSRASKRRLGLWCQPAAMLSSYALCLGISIEALQERCHVAAFDGVVGTERAIYVDVVDQFGETETMQVEGIRGYSVSDAISSIERCLAGGWDSSGWKYENDLLIAGGSLCNGRYGWWCANYLWWGFRQAGFSDLWGSGSLQVDPEYVANEYQWLGRYHWGTAGVRRGDILFSYMASWRAGQTITHAAYVVSVSGSSVTVVEGNAGWSNCRTYSLWDPIFKGYARPAC